MFRGSTRRRSKRAWYKELLLNPVTLKWGFFLLRAIDVIRKWI